MMNDRPRVLAVDDSVTIRKALELILVPSGFDVAFAVDGAEALDKAREFQPAVMLLDFILPDRRGTEVCRDLLANPATAGLPVVLISARGAEIRQAYQDAPNVVRYLTKPFTPEEVLGVVADVLGGRGAEQGAGGRESAAWQEPAGEADRTGADAEIDVAVGGPAQAAAETPSADVAAYETYAPVDAPPATAVVEATAAQPVERHDAAGARDAMIAEEADEAASRVALSDSVEVDALRRADLEAMFEVLRAGLEGVYVEESDTPTGAAADQSKSYTELAARLTRQLADALQQAESGRRYQLCADGSIRSLGDTLLDSYRRLCRLLFRAGAATAAEAAAGADARPRVLLIGQRGGAVFSQLEPLARDDEGWRAFAIGSDFRQLPMAVRLFGPSHLIVEVARPGALWDQLETVRSLPEGRHLEIIGVAGPESDGAGSVDAERLRRIGVAPLLKAGAGLGGAVRMAVAGPIERDEAVAGWGDEPLAAPVAW